MPPISVYKKSSGSILGKCMSKEAAFADPFIISLFESLTAAHLGYANGLPANIDSIPKAGRVFGQLAH